MTRVMATAASKRASPEAISQTTTGAATIPSTQVTARTAMRTVATGIHELLRRLIALGGADPRQGRHERLREGAFAEQAPQQVGDAKGDVEGIERGAGAERRGDDHVADQAGDARDQGQKGDRRRGAEQVHG